MELRSIEIETHHSGPFPQSPSAFSSTNVAHTGNNIFIGITLPTQIMCFREGVYLPENNIVTMPRRSMSAWSPVQ